MSKEKQKQDEYDQFSEALRKVLTPEAKKRVDEDKEKRKHPKNASVSRDSDDQT